MSRVLLISGSRRQSSFNSRLLDHLESGLMWQSEVDRLMPHEVSLPIFDQDLECDAVVVKQVATIHARIAQSHALIIASPEYNGQPTPYLKNIVDWVTRLPHIDNQFDNVFLDRPVLLCSASTGWSGGALAIPHLRALFGYVGANVVGQTICIPHADQHWTDGDYVFNEAVQLQIGAAMERVLKLAEARQSSLPIQMASV